MKQPLRSYVIHPGDPNDVRLLQRIAARDTAALAELYDRHSRLLFGLILRIVRDRGEAEDILQEAFIRVWTRAETYDAQLGGPLPWIVRVARGSARDKISPSSPHEPRAGSIRRDRSLALGSDIQSGSGLFDVSGAGADPRARRPPAERRQLIEAAFFEGSLTAARAPLRTAARDR